MKKISFLVVILILVAGGFLAWWINGTLPPTPSDKSPKGFAVKRGQGVREIANNLKSEGLIKDPVIFFIIVKKLGLDQKIQAGDFSLSPSMNAVDIAKALQVGTSDLRVVIPEGKRAEEIADILKDRLGSYQESWRASLVLYEGYLFPDTYSFPKDSTIDQIITIMRNNFEKKYNSIPPNNSTRLSKEQVVIIASLVEREAKRAEDRPLVASVILNRLRTGMPLQIDATIQYALGYQTGGKTWWKKEVTFDDLKINSTYNTYTNPGLPPHPISNPGQEALSAVINVPNTGYLFYVSDKSGHNHYAKTLEEHNANIQKYGL